MGHKHIDNNNKLVYLYPFSLVDIYFEAIVVDVYVGRSSKQAAAATDMTKFYDVEFCVNEIMFAAICKFGSARRFCGTLRSLSVLSLGLG